MDEQRLSELFQDVVSDTPPASFDERDVATAARRVTVRRQRLLAGGSGLVIVVLAVGLLLGTGRLGHTVGNGAASAGVAAAPAQTSSYGGAAVVPGVRTPNSFPRSSSMQGGAGGGKVGAGADSTHAGCGPADGALAVALAGELPSAGAPVAVPVTVTCPAGSRSAAVAVPHGVVVAVLLPKGSVVNQAGVSSASGQWTVLLTSSPTGAVPGDVLAATRLKLAGRF